jgi:hypothetical protein
MSAWETVRPMPGNLHTVLTIYRLVMGRYTESRTDIAIFRKTETDTDVGFDKTEKYRKPKNKNRQYRRFGFFRFFSGSYEIHEPHAVSSLICIRTQENLGGKYQKKMSKYSSRLKDSSHP